jgi:hypothetical protein
MKNTHILQQFSLFVIQIILRHKPKRMDCCKKQTQRVRFNDKHCIINSCSSPLEKIQSLAESNSVWYNGPELQIIRKQALTICTLVKKNRKRERFIRQQTFTSKQQQQQRNLHTRGLEKYIDRRRQHRRIFASKCILYASSLIHNGNKTNSIAAIAARCTAYATDLAIKVAAKDFVEAYFDEIQILCNDSEHQSIPLGTTHVREIHKD